MKIKFCGMTREEDYMKAVELGVDCVGFIFYPKSPRYIAPKEVGKMLSRQATKSVSTVGVVVNPSIEFLKEVIEEAGVDVIQFHGDETADDLRGVKHPYWKVFRVSGNEIPKVNSSMKEFDGANAFLLDTYDAKQYGGTSSSFNWQALKDLNMQKPCWIAGGIYFENVGTLLEMGVYGVDISSGIEKSKGIKDHALMEKMVKKIRSYNE